MPRGSASVQLVRRSARLRRSTKRSASARPPRLGRSNTGSVAAVEGQQFLDALHFDPSQKRVVIPPRRYTILLESTPIRSKKNGSSKSSGPKRQKASIVKKSRVSVKLSSKGSARAAAAPMKVSSSASAPSAAPSSLSMAPKAATFAPAFAPAPALPATRQVPALWKFQSTVPAFALHVTPDSVFFGDQSGRVFMFDHDGNAKKQVQLPAGVKTLVADTRWLYAGCDNGGVYDLTDPTQPRLAYVLPSNSEHNPSMDDIDNVETPDDDAMDVDGDATTKLDPLAPAPLRRKHVTFVVDTSGSMRGSLIDSAVRNVNSIIECQLQDDDLISLVKFNSSVTTIFSSYSKAQHSAQITNQVSALLNTNGTTSLWAAFAKGFDLAQSSPADVEQWIVVLTDGLNNVSSGFDSAAIAKLASERDARIITISVGSSTDANEMKHVCAQASAKGNLSKHITVSASPQGVDEAFKVVAQLLNARVTSLSIADGLVAITDADGSITVCNIDGVKLWSHNSGTAGGWMVRADARSAYQGNDNSILRFNLRNGNMESQCPLGNSILSGCQTPDSLFAAAGSNVYWFSKLNNSVAAVASVSPAIILANAAGMIDNQVHLFAADSSSTISCFPWNPNAPTTLHAAKWRLSCSDIGTPLAMQVFGNRLFVATTKGVLASIDVSPAATAAGAPTISCAIKSAQIDGDATVPLQKLPTTNDAGNGVVVECQRELNDNELLEIHQAIHTPRSNHVIVRGRNYPIEVAPAKKLRFVVISNMKFIEQNPAKAGKYGQMAKSGHKITWCISGHSPRWGLMVDGKVESNVCPLKMRVVSDGFNKNWDVQFPVIENSQRTLGAKFVVQQIFTAENGEYYRAAGQIAQLM